MSEADEERGDGHAPAHDRPAPAARQPTSSGSASVGRRFGTESAPEGGRGRASGGAGRHPGPAGRPAAPGTHEHRHEGHQEAEVHPPLRGPGHREVRRSRAGIAHEPPVHPAVDRRGRPEVTAGQLGPPARVEALAQDEPERAAPAAGVTVPLIDVRPRSVTVTAGSAGAARSRGGPGDVSTRRSRSRPVARPGWVRSSWVPVASGSEAASPQPSTGSGLRASRSAVAPVIRTGSGASVHRHQVGATARVERRRQGRNRDGSLAGAELTDGDR